MQQLAKELLSRKASRTSEGLADMERSATQAAFNPWLSEA